MNRVTLEEQLNEVINLLGMKRWNYSFDRHSWFFPSDVCPHSNSFKYRCKNLYEHGLLERRGDKGSRWGYKYRVPVAPKAKDI